MFLTLYVGDILLPGNNLGMIKVTKKQLSSVFKKKDKGEARYALSVEIIKNHPKKLLYISQEVSIKKVLERIRMHYSKSLDTPVEKGLTLSLDQCPKIDNEKETMNNIPYTSAVGNLMYVMLCKRPDIYFGLVGKSLPEQPRTCSLPSCEENHVLPSWYN